MTNIEQDANTEARHGNREALGAMTRRCERLEGFMDHLTSFPIMTFHVDGREFVLAGVIRDLLDEARAALSDTPEVG